MSVDERVIPAPPPAAGPDAEPALPAQVKVVIGVLLVASFVMIPVVAGGYERAAAAAALVGIVLARQPVVTVLEGARGPALIPVLAATARVQLVSGALLAAGLVISR